MVGKSGTGTKISVQIWKPILEKLNQKLAASCLRRDAYLSKVLEREIDYLDREVSIPNSPAAQTFIAQRLESLDRKLVSLTLPHDLVSRLKEVCERKRIVRDAFFNRLFLLLAAQPTVIDALLFGSSRDWRQDVWSEYKHDGPFFQNVFYPLEPDIDPLWGVRAGLELFRVETDTKEIVEPTTNQLVRIQQDISGDCPLDSVYTIAFEREIRDGDLFAMNCYLPDWKIPGHEAQAARSKKLDDILVDLRS